MRGKYRDKFFGFVSVRYLIIFYNLLGKYMFAGMASQLLTPTHIREINVSQFAYLYKAFENFATRCKYFIG